jgi:hypothetical protein
MHRTIQFLHFPSGLVRGSLANLGISCVVAGELGGGGQGLLCFSIPATRAMLILSHLQLPSRSNSPNPLEHLGPSERASQVDQLSLGDGRLSCPSLRAAHSALALIPLVAFALPSPPPSGLSPDDVALTPRENGKKGGTLSSRAPGRKEPRAKDERGTFVITCSGFQGLSSRFDCVCVNAPFYSKPKLSFVLCRHLRFLTQRIVKIRLWGERNKLWLLRQEGWWEGKNIL